MHTLFLRHAASVFLLGSLCLLPSNKTMAGVDDCLKAAVAMASPSDMAKAAAFASNHATCLSNLAPPQLVPYVALSSSMDVANSSGFLKQVGLEYSDYPTCDAKFNPAQTSLKAMAPVLKPVCGKLGINCQALEQEGANQADAQLAEQIPVIGMLPCACAAANSGLGVAKIADLVKKAQACGSTLAEVAVYLQKGAEGAYDIGKSVADTISSTAGSIVGVVGDAGCSVVSFTGICSSDSPPPPPPPPTAGSVAAIICAPYGGVHVVDSAKNPPNDFSLKCNDGAVCSQKPNSPLLCSSAADQAAAKAKRELENSLLIAQNEFWCGQRRDQLKTETMKQCRDADCRFASGLVIASFHGTCLDSTNGEMAQPAFAWASNGELKYTASLKTLVNESVMRDANASMEDKMRANGCKTFLGQASVFLCTTEVGFKLCKHSVDAGELSECRYSATKEVYPDLTINPALVGALNKARVTKIPAGTTPQTEPAAISEVAPRLINNATLLRASPATSETATPAIVVSDTFLANAALKGCKPFLGRRDELKCDNQAGYDECMQAVNRNMLKQCHNGFIDKP